jgi:DNA polymerase III epsilon subunit-like protein
MNPRQQAIQLARQYALAEPVFLDTETTGLNSSDQIVEICLLDSQGAVLLESLVRPTRLIPRDVISIHGITDELVMDAPAWPEVWLQLEPLLRGRYVGIYNAEFDLRMLRQSHQAHSLVWPGNPKNFCIMKLYAQFKGQIGSYGTPRWHKLEAAASQCDIPVGYTHRARQDTLLAKAVFDHVLASR